YYIVLNIFITFIVSPVLLTRCFVHLVLLSFPTRRSSDLLLTNRTIVPHLYGKTRYTLFSHPSKHTNNYPPNKRWNVLYQYIHARELSLFPIKEVKTDRLFLPESGSRSMPEK